MRLIATLLAAALALPIAATAATPFSVDASDFWFNANESGWGLNIAQQGDIAFLTLYVYGTDSKPTWFVASGMQAIKSGTTVTYTGDLFSTTGPVFSGTFNPNAVTVTKVGTATFEMDDETDGILTYTVNGIRVVKSVVRNTFRANDASGSYIGFLGGSCATSVTGPEESMTININQTPLSFTMNTAGLSGVSCGYVGTYTQNGRLGHAQGSLNCTNGKSGTFSLDGLETGVDGILAHLTTTVGTCNFTSRFAAIRRN
jgi:hypothetical protein